MFVSIISALPELLEGPLSHSILGRAIKRGLFDYEIVNLRDFGIGKHRQIDDYQYGGGSGMVMMCEPLSNCIESLQQKRDYNQIIFMTPDGEPYQQNTANALSLCQNIMIICGHYKGIDERIREKYVTMELSIGDYVLSGGELPAAVVVDSLVRLIPGVLNDETSALSDSFQDGLLSPPVYTRPSEWRGMHIPEVLLSGHDAKIEQWRQAQAEQRTKNRRPDLLD